MLGVPRYFNNNSVMGEQCGTSDVVIFVSVLGVAVSVGVFVAVAVPVADAVAVAVDVRIERERTVDFLGNSMITSFASSGDKFIERVI